MPEDIVRGKGYLTLGTRFKRIGDRLQSDVTRLLKAHGVDVPAALMATLGALDRDGALSVGQLAESLGIAQPGATRNLVQLEALGLIQRDRWARDQRLRLVTLTDEGAKLVERLKRTLWPAVEHTVRDICGGLSGTLLEQLTALETALENQPLDLRVTLEDDT